MCKKKSRKQEITYTILTTWIYKYSTLVTIKPVVKVSRKDSLKPHEKETLQVTPFSNINMRPSLLKLSTDKPLSQFFK